MFSWTRFFLKETPIKRPPTLPKKIRTPLEIYQTSTSNVSRMASHVLVAAIESAAASKRRDPSLWTAYSQRVCEISAIFTLKQWRVLLRGFAAMNIQDKRVWEKFLAVYSGWPANKVLSHYDLIMIFSGFAKFRTTKFGGFYDFTEKLAQLPLADLSLHLLAQYLVAALKYPKYSDNKNWVALVSDSLWAKLDQLNFQVDEEHLRFMVTRALTEFSFTKIQNFRRFTPFLVKNTLVPSDRIYLLAAFYRQEIPEFPEILRESVEEATHLPPKNLAYLAMMAGKHPDFAEAHGLITKICELADQSLNDFCAESLSLYLTSVSKFGHQISEEWAEHGGTLLHAASLNSLVSLGQTMVQAAPESRVAFREHYLFEVQRRLFLEDWTSGDRKTHITSEIAHKLLGSLVAGEDSLLALSPLSPLVDKVIGRFLPSLSLRGCSQVCAYYVKVNQRLPDALAALVDRIVDQLEEDPVSLSTILLNLGKLNWQDDRINSWVHQCLDAPHFSSLLQEQALSNLVYGLALQRDLNHRELVERLLAHVGGSQDWLALSQIRIAQLFFGLPMAPRPSGAPPRVPNVSGLHRSVLDILAQAGENFCVEYNFHDLYSLDVFLPDRNCVVEIEGPHHFYEATRELTASTLLRSQILGQNHQVVHLKYFDFPAEGEDRLRFVLGGLPS